MSSSVTYYSESGNSSFLFYGKINKKVVLILANFMAYSFDLSEYISYNVYSYVEILN